MTTVNDNSNLYYGHTYWNDIPLVAKYINLLCSGDANTSWQQHFKQKYAKKPFKHGLFILCGNGWVEREFIDLGIVKKATGFDYSQDLLDQAQAQKKGRDISYFQADVNKLELSPNTYDLVVNMAALHHVRYLAKFHQQLTKAMISEGIMVSFDYVGPSRNQYKPLHWNVAKKCNKQLPTHIQADLKYPDLRTMLNTDPTEAINSDKILPTHRKFFSVEKQRWVGGGIAYLLLTHNQKIFQQPPVEVFPHVAKLLKIDLKLTRLGVVSNLFSYWVSKPKKELLRRERLVRFLLLIEQVEERFKQIKIQIFPMFVFIKKILLKVDDKLWLA